MDVFIIGAGTASTAAALAAKARGASVAIAEEWLAGGLCETRGCKPTKMILRSARAARDVRDAARFGVHAREPAIEFAEVMARARDAAAKRSDDHAAWLGEDFTYMKGTATVVRPGVVRVGEDEVGYKSLVLATGSTPFVPDTPGLAETPHRTSDTIWSITERPERVVILGGGAISTEFATFFEAMGTRVTILERSGRLLAREDDETCRALAAALAARGIGFRYEVGVQRLEPGDDGSCRITVGRGDEAPETFDADLLLVATGRRPKVDGLGLDVLGVEVTPRGIATDERAATNAEGVYAAGDVAGRWQLTDVAYHEGWVAGTNAAGGDATIDERVVPRALFTYPELASVGLTEAEARERSGDTLLVGRAPLARVGKAQVDGETEGFGKLLASGDGEILGAHLIGGPAAELIQIVAMAMTCGASLDQLKHYIAIHPTFAEWVNIMALRAE
jgi:pyruvate/2-oxoglutarate dehydrogenase complex dihydrolipoamide dehydrogenase (E3) component